MKEMKENLISELKDIQTTTIANVLSRQDKLESYLDSVHTDMLTKDEKTSQF